MAIQQRWSRKAPRRLSHSRPSFFQPALEGLENRCLLSAARTLSDLPLYFEANQGQSDPQVRFLAHGNGYALALTETEAFLALNRQDSAGTQQAMLGMQLVGGNPAPAIDGQGLQAGRINYLLGNDPSQWHTDVPLFSQVVYHQVYRGIDLVYFSNDQHQLEYNF